MNKIYIPKLSQGEASFVEGKKIPGIIMDASLFASYKNPAETIKKSTDFFILDPCTNYFIGGYCKEKSSFKKLPTTPDKPYKVEKLLSDEGIRKYKFVKESIDYQIREKMGQIILPYLYSDSIDDTKFNLNLTMISDGLKLIERDQVKLPVYAMINLGIEVFHDIGKLNQLIARYSDFKDNLEGYFISIDNFDGRKASEEELEGLAYLVFNLSEDKKVYLLKMGDYGKVLCCLGADGYSSSLGGGETFDSSSLWKKITAYGRNHNEKTYVPELFDYLYDEQLRNVDYKCSCSVCAGNNGLPPNWNGTKEHFLERNMAFMDEFSAIADEGKTDFMILKIEQAIELITKYNTEKALGLKLDFLVRWKNVLEKSKHWIMESAADEEVDLDALIEEAKANK